MKRRRKVAALLLIVSACRMCTQAQNLDRKGNVSASVLPEPVITWTYNSQPISIIDDGNGANPSPQEAVAGQKIVLTTTPTAADLKNLGFTFASSTWTAGPTNGPSNNVGNYTMSATRTDASTSITQTDMTKPILTTYWLYPQMNNPVTYKYCAKDSVGGIHCSSTAKATFVVSGPTAGITPVTTQWHVTPPITSCTTTDKQQVLTFGTIIPNSSTTCKPVINPDKPGIRFNATVHLSPGNSGQTEWVQVIGPKDTVIGTGGGGQPIPSTNRVGLDVVLPYNFDYPDPVDAATTTTNDSPDTVLNNTWDIATRIFNARMYLMWTSQIPNSITVPLGYVQWAVSGTATAIDGNTPLWSLTSSAKTTAQFHVAVDDNTRTHGLPTFSHLVMNGTTTGADESETIVNYEEQQ